VEYLGKNVLFEVERSDNRETWTVMMEAEDGVGLLVTFVLHQSLKVAGDIRRGSF